MANFDVRQPEARANFWQALRAAVRSIGNNQVRSAYGDEIEARIASMRSGMRGLSPTQIHRPTRRPQTGLMARHKAIIALVLAHPTLVPGHFEALSMLDSGDGGLESLKKALIDAVIRDPDLDAAALSYHLEGLDLKKSMATVTGEDMKARLPFDPAKLTGEKAAEYLDELLQLVGGKSGLFSQNGISKL